MLASIGTHLHDTNAKHFHIVAKHDRPHPASEAVFVNFVSTYLRTIRGEKAVQKFETDLEDEWRNALALLQTHLGLTVKHPAKRDSHAQMVENVVGLVHRPAPKSKLQWKTYFQNTTDYLASMFTILAPLQLLRKMRATRSPRGRKLKTRSSAHTSQQLTPTSMCCQWCSANTII
jgi:hypothetical protein